MLWCARGLAALAVLLCGLLLLLVPLLGCCPLWPLRVGACLAAYSRASSF